MNLIEMQKEVTRMIDEATKEALVLGDLIEKLKLMPQDAYIYYDFCGLVPNDAGSYRGYYDHVSVGYVESHENVVWYQGDNGTVENFIQYLERQIGCVYMGWKGGEYIVHANRKMWAANQGDSTNTAIVDVVAVEDWRVHLITAYIS